MPHCTLVRTSRLEYSVVANFECVCGITALRSLCLTLIAEYASLLFDDKQFQAAKREYLKAKSLNNNDANIHFELGNTYTALGDFVAATNEYHQVRFSACSSVKAMFNISWRGPRFDTSTTHGRVAYVNTGPATKSDDGNSAYEFG